MILAAGGSLGGAPQHRSWSGITALVVLAAAAAAVAAWVARAVQARRRSMSGDGLPGESPRNFCVLRFVQKLQARRRRNQAAATRGYQVPDHKTRCFAVLQTLQARLERRRAKAAR